MQSRRHRNVTLNQLRYFVSAASNLSMTRAAEEMHIAQSAVSAAIGQLEQQIGSQLFIRQRARGLVLTVEGQEFLHDARSVLAHVDEVLDGTSGRAAQVRGSVGLACFVTLAPFVLPQLLSDLGARYPDLAVDVIETDADGVRDTLRSGAAELAVTYDLVAGSGLDFEPLGTAAPYVVLPADHRLADRESIRLAELGGEPMVLLDLPSSRDYFQSMLVDAGVVPQVRYRSASYEAVRGLVARGHGFSILNQLPAHPTTYDGGEVRGVALDEDIEPLSVGLARLQSVRVTARGRAIAAAARSLFHRDATQIRGAEDPR